MKIFAAIAALNERKMAVLNGQAEGTVLDRNAFRPVLVGLDLDIEDLAHVGARCSSHLLAMVASGRIPLDLAIEQLAIDMVAAGVFYERERMGAPASQGDHG